MIRVYIDEELDVLVFECHGKVTKNEYLKAFDKTKNLEGFYKSIDAIIDATEVTDVSDINFKTLRQIIDRIKNCSDWRGSGFEARMVGKTVMRGIANQKRTLIRIASEDSQDMWNITYSPNREHANNYYLEKKDLANLLPDNQ